MENIDMLNYKEDGLCIGEGDVGLLEKRVHDMCGVLGWKLLYMRCMYGPDSYPRPASLTFHIEPAHAPLTGINRDGDRVSVKSMEIAVSRTVRPVSGTFFMRVHVDGYRSDASGALRAIDWPDISCCLARTASELKLSPLIEKMKRLTDFPCSRRSGKINVK